jgi:hypothetical protein
MLSGGVDGVFVLGQSSIVFDSDFVGVIIPFLPMTLRSS